MPDSDSYPICRLALLLSGKASRRLSPRACSARPPCLLAFRKRVKPNARRNIMNFGLLVSQLPHVNESRVHYDALLALCPRKPHAFAAFWQRLRKLAS